MSHRIPIWIVEDDPGGGLPPERTYSHSACGEPLGWVILPDEMKAARFADYIKLALATDPPSETHPDGRTQHVASLSTLRVVEAAVAGELGLAWEGNGKACVVAGESWFADVLEFHRLLCPEQIGNTPKILDDKTLELRTRLIDEEYQELNIALVNDDLPGAADAMADLIYVILGTAIAMGVDLRNVWQVVHASNMRKAGAPRRADGKVQKGPDFIPPDIAGVLGRQGPLDAGGGPKNP